MTTGLPATWEGCSMIEIVGIEKTYPGSGGLLAASAVKALRGVTLTLPTGGAIALIGESGCGKTTLGRILAGLETYDAGELIVDGVAVSRLSRKERGAVFRKVQLIHQDPYAALNPARTLGQALFDPLKLRARTLGKDGTWIKQRARELLNLVGLEPESTLYKYPHNLSGGQRQRVVIARALTVDPEVLVADEAVSMIDVSLRLGLLQVLSDLRERLGIGIVFISHDVAAVRYVARDGAICVIYRGEIVEYGAIDDVIQAPVHPYTQALLSAMPVLRGLEEPGPDRYVPSEVMEAGANDIGCLFAPRCPFATDHCRATHPYLVMTENPRRLNACFYPQARRVVAVPVRRPPSERDRVGVSPGPASTGSAGVSPGPALPANA